MRKPVSLIIFSLLICLNQIDGQVKSEIADKIVRTSLLENKGYNWLKELCEIGPRLSGSENSMKAIKWAQQKMLESKFDSVWLQPVMVPHWVRGKIEEAVIEKSKKFEKTKLTITALGGSVATPNVGITAEVLEVKSLDEAAKLGEKAIGKIIFYNRSFDNGLASSMEGYGKAVDQRSSGAAVAAKVGAVAVLVRSIQSSYDDFPHTGMLSYRNTESKIPGATISVVDADFLSKAIKEEPNLNLKIKLDCKTLPDAQSYNVIGEIKGCEKPNEVIVVGGHWDSWDKGCGAQDDGAPSIQTMEVIDLFKRLEIKPKRTIRCVLFINEENGLKGAIEYGKYSANATEKHLAAIESDRGAFSPRGFYVTTDSTTITKLQKWLPILNKAKIDWIRKGGSGADVGQIKNAKALFGFVSDDSRYMDFHHSSKDIFESVHPREMQLGTAAISLLTYLLSEEGL